MLLELAQDAGLNPKRKSSTYGGEYFSPCPKCGGNDRFLIWPHKKGKNVDGAYWCRSCNIKGDTIQFCVDILGFSYPDAFRRCGVENRPNHFKPIPHFTPSVDENFRANKTWQHEIGILINWANDSIFERHSVLSFLNRRGIPEEAVKLYQIGYLPCVLLYKRQDLELPPSGQGKDSLWIPKGITVPTMEGEKPIRLKVRRSDWIPGDTMQKYIAISGSLSGLNIIGDRSKNIVIAVESELDAYAVHWLVKDRAFVIAIGSNAKNPDSMTHDLVKNAKRLLILHDNDEGGQVMLKKWQGLYGKAIGCRVPVGKDIGEAFEQSYDVKTWLEGLLLNS